MNQCRSRKGTATGRGLGGWGWRRRGELYFASLKVKSNPEAQAEFFLKSKPLNRVISIV